MKIGLSRLWQKLRLNYGQKVFLMASVPLVLAVTAIAILVANQSRQTAETEIAFLENELISAKKAELKNYLSLARTAFINIYGRALPDDEQAKLEVTRILAAMVYGRDGYFFVYDYDGTNLVSPRRTELIGKNQMDLKDSNGEMVVKQMIDIARQGGGYLTYDWPKPSTGKTERMVSYV
ncbi:MAG TPA: histidine kinase, partial [Rhodobacteraceae bacterium]|nr:histidine kinase [Paracoccaceae bacterium]